MITKEEIVQIIRNREDRLDSWLGKNPEKLTVKKLKLELKKWNIEISDADKLAKENDPLFTDLDLGKVYTFMNMFSAIRASYTVALVYIKKLESKKII